MATVLLVAAAMSSLSMGNWSLAGTTRQQLRGDAVIENRNLCIGANGLLHCWQDTIGAYDVQLEDGDPKTFHKILDGLESPHSNVE